MPTSNVRNHLESLAWAVVGLALVTSLGFCVVAVVITVLVEHVGVLDGLKPLSAWLLTHMGSAATVFGVACVLPSFGVSGVPMRIALLVAIVVPFAYGVITVQLSPVFDHIVSWFWLLVSNAWWVGSGLISVLLVAYAISTSPRSVYGYVLISLIAYTIALVGLCTYAVFQSTGFATWSPWLRLALCAGIATSCFTLGLGMVRLLVKRWPPSDNSRKAFEIWLVPVGGIGALAMLYGVWQFAVSALGYEGWLPTLIAGLSVAGVLGFAALLVLGAIVSLMEVDSTDSPDGSGASDDAT